MTRVLIPAFLIVVAFMVFTVADIALIDHRRIRTLPRGVWIILAIVLPIVGGVLWIAVGRVRAGDAAAQGSMRRMPLAPDDDPAFLGKLNREKDLESRIEQLEKELRDLDDDTPQG
ncbi:MAG: PLD nuclease N-terminal domain-containing protein [Pseudolysinimonas sp.]